MNNSEIGERFDRIESKIDKLSEAMISLARTEEKLIALESDRTNLVNRVNKHSDKIDDLNDRVTINQRVVQNITKITWLIVAAGLTVAAKVFVL